MRITESRLRQVIRSVIRESAQEELEGYDMLGRGYFPNVQKIGSAYFRYVHNGGDMSPQEWADANLNMNSYSSNEERQDVLNILKKAANSPAHYEASGR